MIRFLLDDADGRVEEIALGADVPPDLTVLEWLRLHRHRTGTKEGCGSGDCGACTVVVASASDDEGGDVDGADAAAAPLRHEAINACITFVGALHGRLLVTVESLARGGTLHPVQRAMVDEHGSQCGFCTPGFVMSLYALYRAEDAPDVTLAAPAGRGEREAAAAAGGPRSTPADLGEPTPVVAYRSAANADSARVEPAALARGGRAGAERLDGESRAGDGPRPMTSPGGWADGLESERVDGLSHRIDRVLGGNLCRCTGYRPIKRAALVSLAERTAANAAERAANESDDGAHGRERRIAARLREIALEPPEHPGFHAPRTVAELAALRERYPDAPLLGGGTDLALEVTQNLADLPRLIHVRDVAELVDVGEEDGVLTLGAAVSLTRCTALLGERVPGARELLLRFGSDQIRNQGTVGGNLGSASPIGDLPPLLLALGATLVLQHGAATREIALEDYFVGYRETALERGEFVRAARVPLPADDELCAVYKVSKRVEDDISTVCGAFRLTFAAPSARGARGPDADGAAGGTRADGLDAASPRGDAPLVRAARVAFGGMAATPARAPAAEAALVDRPFERGAIERAAAALAEDFTPLDDARASAAYRLQVAGNLLRRAFLEAREPEREVRVIHGER